MNNVDYQYGNMLLPNNIFSLLRLQILILNSEVILPFRKAKKQKTKLGTIL